MDFFFGVSNIGREQFDWKPLVDSALEKIFKDCPLTLAIILDVPLSMGKERQRSMGKILDTMESMSNDSHERIRQAFLTIGKTLPQAKIIDASRTKEEVRTDVCAAVRSVL